MCILILVVMYVKANINNGNNEEILIMCNINIINV